MKLSKKKRPQQKKKTVHRRSQRDKSEDTTWVDRIQFEPVDEQEDDDADDDKDVSNNPERSIPLEQQQGNEDDNTSHSPSISIVSWNVLAASYCSRRSQRNLPRAYQSTVFSTKRRQRLLQRVLQELFAGEQEQIDVICLQEVDLPLIKDTLVAAGFDDCCETDRTKSGGRTAGKVDSCAIYVRTQRWTLLQYEQICLDDLATLSSSVSSSSSSSFENDNCSTSGGSRNGDSNNNSNNINNDKAGKFWIGNSNIQGIQQAFLRRNMALLARLQHKSTGRTVVVANAHLYWHPDYEYVKLCQAHYILQRARQFVQMSTLPPEQLQLEEPFVLCGDFNSKPRGVTYSYLSRGFINAKRRLSPWYTPTTTISTNVVAIDPNDTTGVVVDNDNDNKGDDLVDDLGQLVLDDDKDEKDNDNDPPPMRYLLDFTLNKFCRWLRILGQDTTLETDDEEKLRTGEGNMLLFDKCRREGRTLVTTSTRLVQRKDCPSSVYCINPTVLPNLEVTLVHLLLTHGVVLDPKKFLTRCVVCNGSIVGVEDLDEAKAILEEYQAPSTELIGTEKSDLNVYKCDCCGQGYWFSERPNSSASRVLATATRLFEICLRAGVPCTGDLGAFDHVDIEKERARGWDWTEKGSELLRRPLQVIDWLKSQHLACPFKLESAYAKKTPDGNSLGEVLPFTNVTHDFVDTLDYIFYDNQNLVLTDRLYAPTTFPELNTGKIKNGHLIPSNIWPSDHLAIGARLSLLPQNDPQEELSSSQVDSSTSYCLPINGALSPNLPPMTPESNQPPLQVHGQRCDCGCVPPTRSLFEMAELRRQARLAKETSAEAS